MKPRTAVVVRIVIPLALVCAAVVLVQVQEYRLRERNARQSAFFKTYRPEPVLDGFKLPGRAGNAIAGRSSGGVLDEAAFDASLVVRAADIPRLAASLRRDMEVKLQGSGARVDNHATSDYSFQLQYTAGKAAGVVTVDVVDSAQASYAARSADLRPGERPILVKVRIHEGWAPRPVS